MLKYIEFILENADNFKLYYSYDFKYILKNMESDKVAKLLLQIEDNSYFTGKQTLIDITDKNDKISFVQSNRISRKTPKLKDEINLPITIRNSQMTNRYPLWDSNRTEMSIGRWVNKTFTDVLQKHDKSLSLSNSDLEKFVNNYKSTYDEGTDLGLELVEGEEIRHWYCFENYEKRDGQLGSSCMRQKRKSKFFDIYVKNPDACKLLILKSKEDETKIKGRALVWRLDNGDYYQDRIYTHADHDFVSFEKWAKKKGMKYYSNNEYDIMKITLGTDGDFEYEYYPYMDTFKYYSPGEKILTNNESKFPNWGYQRLESVDGGFDPEDSVWSDWDDSFISARDSIETIDAGIMRKDQAIYVKFRDEWYSPDYYNLVYSNTDQETHHIDDCVFSEILDDWLFVTDDLIELEGGDYCSKDMEYLYFKSDDKYFSRIYWIRDPFTSNLIDKESFKDINKKLKSELGDYDKAESRLMEIFKIKTLI